MPVSPEVVGGTVAQAACVSFPAEVAGPIEVGDVLWWAPSDGKAFEVVKVTGLQVRADGESMVKTASVRTGAEFWNRESLTRALCKRAPKRERRKLGAGESSDTNQQRGSHSVNLMAQDSLAGSKDVDAPHKTVVVSMADFFPGFDLSFYRWWDRLACFQGHTGRGFDFHEMGLPRGRHVLPKVSRAQSKPVDGSPLGTETGVLF